MSFQEISNSTKNFDKDNMISSGKMGTMYKAVLLNGCFTAVKRLHESSNLDEKFIYEIRTLGRLRHNNLVPLLGFCIERRERILVYKYMSNGNLYDWLHQGVEDDNDHKVMMNMEWPLRVRIAVGVARVLAWLHHNFNFSTVHLNINSNCILLDQNFEPKLSNFRGKMLIDPYCHNSRNIQVANTEFWNVITKKDVYSFGIVLLELITLKERSQMTGPCGSSTTTPEDNLIEWVGRLLSSASAGIYQGIDKCLVGKGFDYEIFRMLRIASKCVQPLPDERPTMLLVYKKLRAVGERYGLTYNSGIAKQQPEDGIVETAHKIECCGTN
ncbi:hypothetical protein FNV43_RR06313 [Rhamnella rubrinervis]|uniref:Protein kinase domain-containing protein n=1 Tax=Rhamnella rubrinervis TaxID=2594499 RepID=A0A8K0MLN4_9ROSA|nr:hypothetical protein FNV43_RR06313 [Rhamnella rubrinervis]